jgi:hypothetical protein
MHRWTTWGHPAADAEQTMSEQLPPIERHAATDRFGKRALRTAHELGAALPEDEPVLLRRDGPHRSIGGLEALLDEALADDEAAGSPPPGTPH